MPVHDNVSSSKQVSQQKSSHPLDSSSLSSQPAGDSKSPPAFQLKASGASEAPKQLKAEAGGGNGMPSGLVGGFQASTGHDLSNVNVHFNSNKPSEVGAHAYAQGNDIHLASGQEKHLPHEAAHIVQQREGRVKANTEVAGMPVNDNKGLESEADSMGAKASQMA
ncbi:MAG TPA: DUF4157 domain-containing protein [Bacteroidetes bacterium]|nr:DUF4157 domain-containing protein [Bacteroidota bacterium]